MKKRKKLKFSRVPPIRQVGGPMKDRRLRLREKAEKIDRRTE